MISPVRFGMTHPPQQFQNKAQLPASQPALTETPAKDTVQFGSFGGALSGSNFHAAGLGGIGRSGRGRSGSGGPPPEPTEEEKRAEAARQAKTEAEWRARIAETHEKARILLTGPLEHVKLPANVDQALARIAQAHPGKNILQVLGQAPWLRENVYQTPLLDELHPTTIPALDSSYIPPLAEWVPEALPLKHYLMLHTISRFEDGEQEEQGVFQRLFHKHPHPGSEYAQKEEKLLQDPAYAQRHEREIAAILSQVLTTAINRLDPANA